MSSAKQERLYGSPVQKAQHKRQGTPMTPGQTQQMVEGGFVNDRTGKETEAAREGGFVLGRRRRR